MFRGHATRYGTMAHELAHQIDFKYRNFKTLNEMGVDFPVQEEAIVIATATTQQALVALEPEALFRKAGQIMKWLEP